MVLVTRSQMCRVDDFRCELRPKEPRGVRKRTGRETQPCQRAKTAGPVRTHPAGSSPDGPHPQHSPAHGRVWKGRGAPPGPQNKVHEPIDPGGCWRVSVPCVSPARPPRPLSGQGQRNPREGHDPLPAPETDGSYLPSSRVGRCAPGGGRRYRAGGQSCVQWGIGSGSLTLLGL